jgi:hypothetical protein
MFAYQQYFLKEPFVTIFIRCREAFPESGRLGELEQVA